HGHVRLLPERLGLEIHFDERHGSHPFVSARRHFAPQACQTRISSRIKWAMFLDSTAQWSGMYRTSTHVDAKGWNRLWQIHWIGTCSSPLAYTASHSIERTVLFTTQPMLPRANCSVRPSGRVSTAASPPSVCSSLPPNTSATKETGTHRYSPRTMLPPFSPWYFSFCRLMAGPLMCTSLLFTYALSQPARSAMAKASPLRGSSGSSCTMFPFSSRRVPENR